MHRWTACMLVSLALAACGDDEATFTDARPSVDDAWHGPDAADVPDGGGGDATDVDAAPADATVADASPIDAAPTSDAAPTVDAAPNQPPNVAATITAPATLLAGNTGTFSITATDPDGDPLTYSWSQTSPASQGTWASGQSAATATWFSPEIGTQTSFTLRVAVSDGVNPAVERTVTVPVTVPHFTDVQAIFTAVPCTGCHGTSGGLTLSSNAYANLVNVTANNSACNTLDRVEPGLPDSSVLVRKMSGTACGDRMPRNNPTYFDSHPGDIVRVRSWILAGAAND